jgi:hypothetical protein
MVENIFTTELSTPPTAAATGAGRLVDWPATLNPGLKKTTPAMKTPAQRE